ncbi:MAG: glycosyltransferase family 2 protein [Alistipes sp.]|nr:glycosyltransferase family 2 protein [Alistipes sp.]
MVIVGWIIFAFGVVRLVVASINLISRPYLPSARCQEDLPEVSVLIPARNEEENLVTLFSNFEHWRNEICEVIVYDDQSSDDTYRIVRRYSTADPKIRVIKGCDVPADWYGKNYACARLSSEASGRFLLFVDADVRLEKGSIAKAVYFMDNNSLELLSIFPRQILDNWGNRLCVPLMNWILLSLLPLCAVRLSSRPSLAAANGQFMMFDSGRYRLLQPHNRYRMSAVEDIAIIIYYKEAGLPVAVLLGHSEVSCRMYKGLRDAVRGFSKNIFDFFGGKPAISFLFTATTTVAPLWIFAFNGPIAGYIYLAVIVLIRIFVSIASKQNPLWNILLALPQQIMLCWINLISFVHKKNGRLVWKGRNISH